MNERGWPSGPVRRVGTQLRPAPWHAHSDHIPGLYLHSVGHFSVYIQDRKFISFIELRPPETNIEYRKKIILIKGDQRKANAYIYTYIYIYI